MIYGSAATWATHFRGIYGQVIGVLPDAWAECASHFKGQYQSEQKVTDKLVLCLRRQQQKLGAVGWYVQPSWVLLDELRTGDPTTKGIVDFVVKFGHSETIYVAFECKWLNVVRKKKRCSQVGAYVSSGVMRYVLGKYAEQLPRGVMLGYVFDGDTAFSEQRLQRLLKRSSRAKVSATRGLTSLACSAGAIRRFESKHGRASGEIVVDHYFCPYA